MANAFISLNIGRLTADVRAAKDSLPAFQKRVVSATSRVMFAYVSDTIAAAQDKTAVRSGDLKASAVVQDPVVGDKTITCEGGFNSRYAAQRNFGGTIRAKPGKMLTIPLPAALTASGVSRFSSARELGPEAFVLRLFGKAYIVKYKGAGKGRSLEFYFVLKDHVDQKGDGFFSNVIDARRPQAAGAIAAGVAGELGGRQ